MDNDLVLVIVVGTALAFDFTNGFHDTANAVATSISTRAMSPRVAVTPRRGPELRRRVPLARGRGDDRQGHRRRRPRHADDRLRRPHRRDLLEPARPGTSACRRVLARADRRRGRRGVRRRGPGRGDRRRAGREGHHPGAGRPRARLRRRAAWRSSSPTGSSAASGRARSTAASASGRSSPAACSRSPTGTNDAQKTMGIIFLALVANGNLAVRAPTSRPGSSSRRRPRSPPAPTSAAGGSSRRWARRIIKMDPPQGFAAQGAGAAVILVGVARRLPAVDHARDLGRDHGRGRGQARLGGALGRRRQHRRRLGAHAARRRRGRRAHLRRRARSSGRRAPGRCSSPSALLALLVCDPRAPAGRRAGP